MDYGRACRLMSTESESQQQQQRTYSEQSGTVHTVHINLISSFTTSSSSIVWPLPIHLFPPRPKSTFDILDADAQVSSLTLQKIVNRLGHKLTIVPLSADNIIITTAVQRTNLESSLYPGLRIALPRHIQTTPQCAHLVLCFVSHVNESVGAVTWEPGKILSADSRRGWQDLQRVCETAKSLIVEGARVEIVPSDGSLRRAASTVQTTRSHPHAAELWGGEGGKDGESWPGRWLLRLKRR